MNRTLLMLLLVVAAPSFARGVRGGGMREVGALERVSVRANVTREGTYRPAHYRTAPDSSRSNNWSTKGNTNPMTGAPGTKKP